MTTLLLTHPSSLEHDTGPGHPERADRIRAIEQVLAHETFAGLQRAEAPRASREQLELAHPSTYVEGIEKARPGNGRIHLDGDTVMSPGSWEAALRAAGAAIAAVDRVAAGEANNAFCALRPPGHHAERARAMGFCMFSNAAIAGLYARSQHGAKRVAVVDFDVHHGNGTQDIFWNDKDFYYGSTHQMPLFPGTGAVTETGVGNIFNAPLRAGDGGEQFREAVESRILPSLKTFGPEMLIISAGFDAHVNDPLASIALVEADFAWVTRQLMDVADAHCEGRIVSVLEGGYDLKGLAGSVAAHVATLMEAG